MKILVVGSGGREHALVWRLSQSSSITKIWCAPGNGGVSAEVDCLPVDTGDPAAIADLAQHLKADLTVIGPELPLVNGVADEFASRKIKVFGPNRSAARLEGSKIFAKEFLQRHHIPTANIVAQLDDFESARNSLNRLTFPAVFKADGLCAGKGVLVAQDYGEAVEFLERALLHKDFGEGGLNILVEEALSGPELSLIIVTDGKSVIPMVPSRDHKRLLDADRGPNTGGMGAYSTDELLPEGLRKEVFEGIVTPTIRGLERDGIPYCGFLYFGLMLTTAGPKVLEFNCRSGDPETQAIVMRMNFNLAELLDACCTSDLARLDVGNAWRPGASVCVVLASAGYPGTIKKGNEIFGLTSEDAFDRTRVFHAGTLRDDSHYYTSGGRVLGVCAAAGSLSQASSLSYDIISSISFEGMQHRSDIGCKLSHSASRPV